MAYKIFRLLKNPRTLRVVLWIGSLLISWVFNRLDKANGKKSVKAKRAN